MCEADAQEFIGELQKKGLGYSATWQYGCLCQSCGGSGCGCPDCDRGLKDYFVVATAK